MPEATRSTKTAVIIPAYNEGGRIASVLRAVSVCKLADEVIVVSDGSVDNTAEVAARFPQVRVIKLLKNQGKGAAMLAGVKATEAAYVAFVDADLVGLRAEHVDSIFRPLLAGYCDMSVGIFRGGKFWSDTAQKVVPHLSGQRAMRRELFLAIPHIHEVRMGVEVAINQYVKRRKARVLRVVLRGVANYHKEMKMGYIKGSKARIQMYSEIAAAMVRVRRKRTRPLRTPWKSDKF